MKKIWPWMIGVLVLVLLCYAVWLGIALLSGQNMPMHQFEDGPRLWRTNFFPMRGMYWRLPVMGLFGWLLLLFYPLGVLALLILGATWLVRVLGEPASKNSQARAAQCDRCGKLANHDWQVRPYCGQPQGEG